MSVFTQRVSIVALSTILAGVFFIGCSDDDNDSSVKKNINIRMAETTDMHGAIFPYDFINNTDTNYKGDPIPSLANVSTYVKAQKALDDADEKLVFYMLDNGDLLQGQPIVNVFNNKDMTQNNHIYAETMNYIGYDVATVGNHDVDPGHAVYDKLVNQFNFPWLAANAVKEGTEHESYFKPYTILNNEGVKIAVLGITTPGVPMWLPHDVWSGIEYKDMVDSAKYWVSEIRTKEKPDLLIGLFHAGYDFEYGGFDKNEKNNPNAIQLVAEQVEGFDFIFFGHDHQPLITEVNGVTMAGGGSYCNVVHVADINLTWNETTQSYDKNISANSVAMSEYAIDENFMSEFNSAFEETKTFVNQPVGTFTTAVNSRDAAFGDAPFNDLIHELEFYVANSVLGQDIDMSIAAPLQYDVTIEAGDVKFADMWKLYKYDNTYYIMTMSGQEIINYLEYNYDNWMNQMTDENDHLIKFKLDDSGEIVKNDSGCAQTQTRYYNYDSIAGIVYTVDVSKAKGERVEILGMDKNLDGKVDEGVLFSSSMTYKVGINSYRAGGGGGHMLEATGLSKEELPNARTIAKTETGLREYLLNWMKDQGSVTPRAFNNWKVIPEDWALKGAEKSRAEVYSDACIGH